jgi:predicted RND superfamily exporter protein
VPIGLASGMAKIDAHLKRDSLRLFPIAALLVTVLLFAAFRHLQTVMVAMLSLLLGIIWVYGLMGWLDISLNIVNVALFPLILGSGIDYAIHLVNAYQTARTERAELISTFRVVARQTGVALIMVTLITVVGLLTLVFSGVPGMVELGFLSAFGMLALFLLAVTFLPAILALTRSPVAYSPSPLMASLLSAVQGDYRKLAIVVLLGLTLLGVLNQGRQLYQLDVIQANFPQEDALSQVLEQIPAGVGDVFPEFLIFEGEIADPALLRYTQELERYLRDPELGLGAGTHILGLNRILGSYEALKDGIGPAMARFVGAGGNLHELVPTEKPAIEASLNGMHQSEVWAPLIKLLTSETLDLSVMIVMPEAAATTLADAQALWNRFEQAIEEAQALQPDGVKTTFLGYRTISYLFAETSLFWMRLLFAISLLAACMFVFIFTCSLRPTFAVVLTMILTGVWWSGLLSIFGIYISIFLIFPLVFIVSIGSDFAVHLVWNVWQRGDEHKVYATTGKAILFSALTAAGVFLVFTLMYLVSVTQIMSALVIAIIATFVCTVLTVPLFLKRLKA